MKDEEEEQAAASSPAAGDHDLRRVLDLVDSSISSSYSITCFPGKWRSIRYKLQQLSSGLSAAAVDSGELLEAIAATVNETQVLVRTCSGESFAGGKLLIRSDLDVIASKLDLHTKCLMEIYASRIPANSQAIVVSRPAAGASWEDMIFYVKDLFSRLRIGDPAMSFRALVALNEALLHEDDGDQKYARIIALGMADGAAVLVSFLEMRTVIGIQEEAAKAVAVVAGVDSCKGALISAGAIAPLIGLLEIGSQLGKESAAGALKKLTENSDNLWSVSANGGVTALLRICAAAGGGSTKLIGFACETLSNLSSVKEIKSFMVEEGAVSVLWKLAKSTAEASQIPAIELIIRIASGGDDSIKQRFVREGAVRSLVSILDPSSCHSSKARDIALRAIQALCFSSMASMNDLISSTEFLSHLLFFLKNGEVSTQELALKAVSHLCQASEAAKKAMGDAGFMPELLNLLESKSFEVREMSAGALCGLVSVQRNRRRFAGDEWNVSRILKLLNPDDDEKSPAKKSLLSVLMPLAESNSGRRKIVASEYMKNLEKLADAHVLDAMKIVKKLSSNRIRDMIHGIWSSRTE